MNLIEQVSNWSNWSQRIKRWANSTRKLGGLAIL